MTKKKELAFASHFIDPSCQDYHKFMINGKRIIAKTNCQIFGINKLVGKSIFSVKFTKIVSWVALGVIDS